MQETAKGLSESNWRVEAIKAGPPFFWVALASLALFLGYPLLSTAIQKGQITKIAVMGVQVELSRLPSDKAADGVAIAKQSIIPPDKQKALTERFENLAVKTLGVTVLWVDDNHPYQNVRERRVLLAAGMSVDLAGSTDEAMKWLGHSGYQILITDLSRPLEPSDLNDVCYEGGTLRNAGCRLLKEVHARAHPAPKMIVYAGEIDPARGTPPFAYAMTNRPDELMHFVLNAIEQLQ